MNELTRAQNCLSAVKSVERVLSDRTIFVNTDVVNACGGEGDGVSTILLQRSLLQNRRNTLQPDKGDHVCAVVIFHTICKIMTPITLFTITSNHILRNSIRALSLTPPEWDIAMFGNIIFRISGNCKNYPTWKFLQ